MIFWYPFFSGVLFRKGIRKRFCQLCRVEAAIRMEAEEAGHTKKEVDVEKEASRRHHNQVLFQTEVGANQRGIGTYLAVDLHLVNGVEGVDHHSLVPAEEVQGNLQATGKASTLKGLIQTAVNGAEDPDLIPVAVERVHIILHHTLHDKVGILVDPCLVLAVETGISEDLGHTLLGENLDHDPLGVGPDLSLPAEIKSIVNPVPEVILEVEVQEFLQDDLGQGHPQQKGQN